MTVARTGGDSSPRGASTPVLGVVLGTWQCCRAPHLPYQPDHAEEQSKLQKTLHPGETGILPAGLSTSIVSQGLSPEQLFPLSMVTSDS